MSVLVNHELHAISFVVPEPSGQPLLGSDRASQLDFVHNLEAHRHRGLGLNCMSGAGLVRPIHVLAAQHHHPESIVVVNDPVDTRASSRVLSDVEIAVILYGSIPTLNLVVFARCQNNLSQERLQLDGVDHPDLSQMWPLQRVDSPRHRGKLNRPSIDGEATRLRWFAVTL